MYENEYAPILHFAADAEICPESLVTDGCSDVMVYELEDICPETRGQIIELTVCIRNVCPGKRTALGVMLHESGEGGQEEPRGMKTMTIPAHNESCNQDILVRHIRFVLPEDLSLAGAGCGRRFAVRALAHYIDLDDGAACACRER